jgi:hypothetical protein
MSESASHTLAGADSTTIVARTATLDGFVSSTAAGDGVSLSDLEPLTTLVVATMNSRYRITVSANAAIFVQGGRFFPDTTEAKLEGSSAGGSFLKVAWIGIGLRMEISSGGRRIVTSPVRAIVRDDGICSQLTH